MLLRARRSGCGKIARPQAKKSTTFLANFYKTGLGKSICFGSISLRAYSK